MNIDSVISESYSKIQDEEERKIKEIFQYLVGENAEENITPQNLEIAAERMGLNLDRAQIENLIAKLDTERNGFIVYTEFREMMINKTIVSHLSEY